MRRSAWCKLTAVALLLAVWSSSQSACVTDGGGAAGLSPALPGDVTRANPTQEDFDNYAWQMFVALNWPTKDGAPDSSKNIGQALDSPRVWELYVDPADIFKGGTSAPATPAAAGGKRFYLTSKRVERLDAGQDTQAASSWPLVDQRGNFAAYEVRFNDVERQYIEKNGLTSAQGLLNFNQPIDLPDDSLEVKAAWRLFPADTDRAVLARYYTRPAVISVPAEQSLTGSASQISGTVGLVGLHISRKTKSQPRWVWATFEHVDNYEVYYKPLPDLTPTFSRGGVPPEKNNRQPLLISAPSPTPAPSPLSSPSPTSSSPTTSSSPSPSPSRSYYTWSPTQPTAGRYQPTEVARCPNEIAPSATNPRWQETLAGVENSPWQYYRLDVVQWFDAGNNLRPKNGDGYAIARNSVLETYLLGDQSLAGQVPVIPGGPTDPKGTLGQLIIATRIAATEPAKTGLNTWSSCVLCHQMAAYGSINTDYSFVFRSFLPPAGH